MILTIPGTTGADEVVVIGGHLDSIALGGSDSNAPGADDDASGIATLTEIARVLLADDYRPRARSSSWRTPPRSRPARLAGDRRDFKERKVNVVGALQLDMTNYQGSDKDSG